MKHEGKGIVGLFEGCEICHVEGKCGECSTMQTRKIGIEKSLTSNFTGFLAVSENEPSARTSKSMKCNLKLHSVQLSFPESDWLPVKGEAQLSSKVRISGSNK